ncbi:MAG: hypothetical protein KIS74_03720 [Burkholderiales bacterium]|nr:hypothetical protein [Burkholderiales bacterium]
MRWAALAAIVTALAPAFAQVRLVAAKPAAESAPPPEPEYVDRVIEGLATQEAEAEAKEAPYDAAGWPRFLRLETRLGTQPSGSLSTSRAGGFTATGVVVTPNHGTLSIDANLALEEDRTAITVRQRGLPMEGGWVVNNELGVTPSLAPLLMRQPSRVYVPSRYARGAATEWLNPALQTQLIAAAGEPGLLQGFPVSGFLTLPGTLATLGAQKSIGPFTGAFRFERGDGLSLFRNPTRPEDSSDTRSAHVAVRATGDAHTIQANAVETRSTETDDTRRGMWVEGEWKRGTSLYGWGVFRLDPKLSWSGQGMASDSEGVYARGSWRTRQWSADANVDALRSISRPDESGVYVSATGRWRYSRSLNLGAGGSYRDYSGSGGSVFADARFQNEWGSSGARIDGTSGGSIRVRRVVLDHAWNLPQGWALNTSLGFGRESGENAAGSIRGGAVSFSAPLGNEITMLGNASTERRGDGSRSTSANVSLLWRVDANWSLEGNYIYSNGRQRQSQSLDPLAPPPDTLFLPADSRSYFLVLRYEEGAGTGSVPLGGAPGTGGGSIEGVVFLDANRTGTQEAGEAGAAGVTVYLDGRFATRTDALGRFEFPFVAAGTRVIRVLDETLPLPWESGERRDTSIEVVVREASRVAIPVVKRGGE